MAADVSLVFETSNEQAHRRIGLADIVAAWKGQTAGGRILEWILVSQHEVGPEPLGRLWTLRRPLGIPVWRLPLCAAFFLWYCVAAGAGWRRANRGQPEPLYRF